MVNLLDYKVATAYINDKIESMPNKGRGIRIKLSEKLGIHTSTLSQILASDRNLTLEQASHIADFFGLNEIQTQYFLILALYERAGTKELKRNLEFQMKNIKNDLGDLKKNLKQDKELNEQEKAVLCSNWYYIAIWVQTSIKGFETREALASHFNLSHKIVNQVVDFLLSTNMLEEVEGQLKVSFTYAHLGSNSSLIARHHANFRMLAMQKHTNYDEKNLSYTAPMSISKEQAINVRNKLLETISEINKMRELPEAEVQFAFNLDWFEV